MLPLFLSSPSCGVSPLSVISDQQQPFLLKENLSLLLSFSLSLPQAKMASTEAEEPSQSFKTKTSVLRVSIHCQGCKRKVQKLLQSVPGVQEIRIEAKLQRVEVTGDVSAETLLRKLVKAGKHAELWPEKPPEIRVKETEKPTTTSQGSVSEESPVSVKEIKPPTTKTENPVEDPKKVSKTAAPGGGEPAVSGGKGDESVGKSEGGKESAEVKAEEKKPETGAASNQASQPASEKKEEQNEKDGGGGGGGGEGKKKKKKKAQNSDKNGSSSGQPPSNGRSVNGGGGGGGSPPPTRPPTNPSPPRHNGYQYPPPHYYTPPPAPVYTVSYNTAQPPVNSYTASYYTPPPPQSYAYSHFSSQMAPPPYVPPDYDSYRQQPSDSFEMFSDENPNGCLVM